MYSRGLRLNIMKTLLSRKYCQSTFATTTAKDDKVQKFDVAEEMNRFRDFCPKIKQKVLDSYSFEQAKLEFSGVVDYLLSPDEIGRSKLLMIMYNGLIPHTVWNDEIREQLYTLSWVYEMLSQAMNLVDDYVDQSEFRINKRCWHTLDENNFRKVPSIALLMYHSMHYVIQHSIKNDRTFRNLWSTIQKTQRVLCVENLASIIDKKTPLTREDVKNGFNRRLHLFYGGLDCYVYLPLFLAEYNTIPAPTQNKLTRLLQLMIETAVLGNDYDDTFKPGLKYEDISVGKISWVLTTAMERASDDQIKIIQECYGQGNAESIEKVLQVFRDLNIPKVYKEIQAKLQTEIFEVIRAIDDHTLRNALDDLLRAFISVYNLQYDSTRSY